jgi:hypothetical protein
VDVKSSQATGNAAMHYVAWQLSKRGWHVMPTMRNAKGSDLYCANDAESVVFGVQSNGLSKRDLVGLGTNLDNLRSQWWIITINAKSDSPTCFVMERQEVVDLCAASDAAKSHNGVISYWLSPKAYDQEQFRDAWHRLCAPTCPVGK